MLLHDCVSNLIVWTLADFSYAALNSNPFASRCLLDHDSTCYTNRGMLTKLCQAIQTLSRLLLEVELKQNGLFEFAEST